MPPSQSLPKHPINRKNIIFSDYNPNTDTNLRNTHANNKNIITNQYDINNHYADSNKANLSRPSHKTHVEIITKNGATKKPNIIVNNYDPDVILTSTNFNHNTHGHQGGHQHPPPYVRNDIGDNFAKSAYDRKITCMLYLQADHTFAQKMGSDEASIEAITRHVQRANVIYKNTGESSINFFIKYYYTLDYVFINLCNVKYNFFV